MVPEPTPHEPSTGVPRLAPGRPPEREAQAHRRLEPGAFPVTEGIAERLVSLAMFPEITDDQIDRVIEVVGNSS